MTDQTINFDTQKLKIDNDSWTVELWLESGNAESKVFESKNYSRTITLSDSEYIGSQLVIKTTDHQAKTKSCLITGIDGTSYLHTASDYDISQTVKLSMDNLVLSLGSTFFSYNLDKQEINWKVKPDPAEIFEFYDFQDDYLLRGELEIHRIDSNGKVKWSYRGRDIWVNMDGKKEVNIENDKVRLIDFEGNVYLIDFNGQALESPPLVRVGGRRKKWWEVWK
jgi:hypothetical protein